MAPIMVFEETLSNEGFRTLRPVHQSRMETFSGFIVWFWVIGC